MFSAKIISTASMRLMQKVFVCYRNISFFVLFAWIRCPWNKCCNACHTLHSLQAMTLLIRRHANGCELVWIFCSHTKRTFCFGVLGPLNIAFGYSEMFYVSELSRVEQKQNIEWKKKERLQWHSHLLRIRHAWTLCIAPYQQRWMVNTCASLP